MDISGINNNLNNNNLSNAKNKVADDSFEKRLRSALDGKNEKELKSVCQEFEGIFLKMMYNQMKATVSKSSLLEESAGREIFDTLLDDELVKEASKTGRLGLADMLYKQLSKQLDSTYVKGDSVIDEKK